MVDRGIVPDSKAYGVAMRCVALRGHVEAALQLLDAMRSSDTAEPDCMHYNDALLAASNAR